MNDAPRRSYRRAVPEIQPRPLGASVSHLVVDLVVAGSAQGHEVGILMGSALRNRNDMMDLIHHRNPSFPVALLTVRIQCGMPVPCFLPGCAIFLFDAFLPRVPVVLPVHHGSWSKEGATGDTPVRRPWHPSWRRLDMIHMKRSCWASLRVSSLLSPIRLDLRNWPYLIFFSRIVFPFFLMLITQIRPFLGIAGYKNTPPRNRRIPVRFGVFFL